MSDHAQVTTTAGGVTDYAPVNIRHADNDWGGLQYNNAKNALLEGSIGSYRARP